MRRMEEDDGRSNGLNESDRGHTGVITNACTEGCTIGPPDDKEYAVEPVGVETMRPSDWGKA